MNSVKDDTLEVIKTLKNTEEYNQVLEEYQEVKKDVKFIIKSFDSMNEKLEEIKIQEQEVDEVANLVEVQKYNFGINVLNSVLLVCILVAVFLSKLD